MVVLAASICTRGGRAILSRQFRDLHKDKVAALLANFPKLTHSGTQHTTVEDDNVRYVYQPVEELYVVLITNRQSNILQDIETLGLLTQIVASVARNVDEREILANAYELLSAFDEIVTLGYRENLSLSQVKTFLEMESHEEKIQEIIERNKELEAAEERKKKAKQLEMQRREAMKRGAAGGGMGGMGGGGMGGINSLPQRSFTPPQPQAPVVPETVVDYNSRSSYSTKGHAPRGKGLQLGKKKTGALDQLRGEVADAVPLMSEPQHQPQQQQQLSAVATPSPAPKPAEPESTNEGIEISIVEQLNAKIGKDGTVQSSEVKGNLQLRIADSSLTKIKLLTRADGPPNQYKTHPNVDKNAFQQTKTIGLKDPNRPFPSNNQQLGVLRWKMTARGDDVNKMIPINFNCWFSKQDSNFYDVTIEYELNEEATLSEEPIRNIQVTIPLVSSNAHVSDPSQVWEQYDDHLVWTIPEIQPGTDSVSGAFEFSAEADQEEDFLPMNVNFQINDSLSTFGKVDVLDVVSATNESESLPFEKKISVATESYSIEP